MVDDELECKWWVANCMEYEYKTVNWIEVQKTRGEVECN
jgi:hypothetical protein